MRLCDGIFFLLAVSLALPLYVYGLRGIWLTLEAGAICVGFAALDEYHQLFVSGRGASKRDVAIDSIGIFAGIIVTRIIGWMGREDHLPAAVHEAKSGGAERYKCHQQSCVVLIWDTKQ